MSVLKEEMVFSQPDGEVFGFMVLSLCFSYSKTLTGKAAHLGLGTTAVEEWHCAVADPRATAEAF